MVKPLAKLFVPVAIRKAPSGKNRSLPAVGATFSSQLAASDHWLSGPRPLQVRVVATLIWKLVEVAPVKPAEEAVRVYVPAAVKATLENVAMPFKAATVVALLVVNVPPAGPEAIMSDTLALLVDKLLK